MKKIWLMGGFGNVLFQIMAYNVLSKGNKNVFFVTKLTNKNRITKFLKWTIHQPLYNNLIDNNQIINVKFIPALITVLTAFLSKYIKGKNQIATFYDKNIQIKSGVSKNVFGYFQDKEFLAENKKELSNLCDKLITLYSSSTKTPIVVHYRKGDSDWALKFSYYYEEIKNLLKTEKGTITIVTDSLEDAKYFFKDISCIKVIRSENALEDFEILISAKKLYCAPSTFSWWAAHCLDQETEVIMPEFFINSLGIYVNTNKLTIV
jgi:hypothetical protein